jgi:hypothetical protein
MFIVDALIGNWDRHNGNWGFLYDTAQDTVTLAPVFDCGSCLYPQLDAEKMRAVLNDPHEMDFRVYEIPLSGIKQNDKKIKYYDFISSLQYANCNAALKRISPRLDLDRIFHLIDETPYLDELQRPNGLFYHAPDVPYYWGRGNGWMAAGMTELLQCLPKNHKDRPRILQGYRTMMESLKKYQNPEGLWNQLIDQSDCWTETSGSAMFTFAFIKGVKNGWLNAEEYAPAARKAWIALVSYLNDKNQVREICVGTNKKNSKQYYYDRPRRTGDYHGQGPYLWCAAALMEK